MSTPCAWCGGSITIAFREWDRPGLYCSVVCKQNAIVDREQVEESAAHSDAIIESGGDDEKEDEPA